MTAQPDFKPTHANYALPCTGNQNPRLLLFKSTHLIHRQYTVSAVLLVSFWKAQADTYTTQRNTLFQTTSPNVIISIHTVPWLKLHSPYFARPRNQHGRIKVNEQNTPIQRKFSEIIYLPALWEGQAIPQSCLRESIGGDRQNSPHFLFAPINTVSPPTFPRL